MKALILRFDAPLMSFGGVIVDHHGFTDRFPGTAMLCGLIANALGLRHSEFDALQTLQSRIRFAARWDVAPRQFLDYQTVDLAQPKMCRPSWTSRGRAEHRGGGPAAKFGTHQRFRHFWADGLMTVALGFCDDEDPDVEAVEAAIRAPARPLFLGRKACLPARPLLDPGQPTVEGEDVLAILCQVAVWDRHGQPVAAPGAVQACWPADAPGPPGEANRVYDLRDWANQVPSSSRLRMEGLIGEGLT